MRNSTFALLIAVIATPSLAATLNPQPEPPGKSQVMNTNKTGTSVQDNQSGLSTGHRLPPGPCVNQNNMMASQTARQNAHCNKRLNPQPEPPG